MGERREGGLCMERTPGGTASAEDDNLHSEHKKIKHLTCEEGKGLKERKKQTRPVF